MTTGPPPRRDRHWWSLAPSPVPAEPISARRAYAEALGVYVAFFGASIVVAAGTLAGFKITNPEGWWITGADGLDELARAGLAVAVVILLAQRRGRRPADIGFVARRAHGGPGLKQGIRIAAWAAVAFIVGSIVTSALATGTFPFGQHSAANTILNLSAAVNAGIVEEAVVLAFLVTTLEQAGRGRLEIAAVALVCRGAYHIYYGPGALGILVWAAVFLWLFWRFRSVVPMVIVHIGWDTLVFLSDVDSYFGGLLVLAALALVITAVVLWLSDRTGRDVTGPPLSGGTAPGWATPAWGPPARGREGSPHPALSTPGGGVRRRGPETPARAVSRRGASPPSRGAGGPARRRS